MEGAGGRKGKRRGQGLVKEESPNGGSRARYVVMGEERECVQMFAITPILF